jgi:regulatory protein
MDYLARREHGRAELTAKLEKAGFDPDICRDAVAQLVSDGLQSDERFVEAYVSARINRGKGPVLIRAELREHGIGDALIDAGLARAAADWAALARSVRRKKFGAEVPGGFAAKARQMRFLQSRGFDGDQIRAAVSTDDD